MGCIVELEFKAQGPNGSRNPVPYNTHHNVLLHNIIEEIAPYGDSN